MGIVLQLNITRDCNRVESTNQCYCNCRCAETLEYKPRQHRWYFDFECPGYTHRPCVSLLRSSRDSALRVFTKLTNVRVFAFKTTAYVSRVLPPSLIHLTHPRRTGAEYPGHRPEHVLARGGGASTGTRLHRVSRFLPQLLRAARYLPSSSEDSRYIRKLRTVLWSRRLEAEEEGAAACLQAGKVHRDRGHGAAFVCLPCAAFFLCPPTSCCDVAAAV